MIGILQVGVQSMADRYTYLPCIGLLVATVWLGSDLADHLRLSSRARIAAVSLILLALAVATWQQQDSWADDYRLWWHALEVTDDNYIAESNFSAFVGSDEASMARENFHRARDTDSDSFEQLIAGYRSRTQQRPSADSYFWLAILEGQAGRRDEAQAAWLKALAIKPEFSSKQDFFEKVIGS